MFAQHAVRPKREPRLGGYRMVLGILMLLFIGFQRLGHFAYVRYDTMVCRMLRVAALPTVSTFWRYLQYVSRVFVTNAPGRPHAVIEDYDQRADAENLIGETQREGVLAIPSKRFQTHHAFFQTVMLAYDLWRWMKLLAGHAEQQAQQGQPVPTPMRIRMPDHTIRIARLKLLYVAAKICFHGNRDEVLYSLHEQRAAGLMDFLGYLDRRRKAA